MPTDRSATAASIELGSLRVSPRESAVVTPKGTIKRLISRGDLSKDVSKVAEKDNDKDLKRVLRGVSRCATGQDVKVEKESIARYLGEQVKRRYESMHAPLIILYYVCFVFMLLGHENTSDMSQMEREFRGMLSGTTFEGLSPIKVSGHKNLGNIDSVSDIYLYLQDAVLPLFVPGSTAAPEPNRVLRYSQLIGGVLLQQTRRPRRSCTREYPGLGPFNELKQNPLLLNFSCFPTKDYSNDCFGPGSATEGFCPDRYASFGTTAVSPNGRRLMPKKAAKGPKLASGAWQIVDYPLRGNRFSMTFNEHEGLDVALRRLREVRDLNWIDEQTAWVGIRIFVMNPDLGIYSSLVVNMFFLQSGEIIPLMQAFTFMVEPYRYKSIIVFDVLWIALWFHLFGYCLWSFAVGCYYPDNRVAYLISPWTWINWVTAGMGLALVIEGMIYIDHLDVIKDSVMNVVFNRPVSGPAGADQQVVDAYKDSVQQLHSRITNFDIFLDDMRRYVGFYCVILMFRLFKAFEVQPRAAIVMQTVVQCIPDILHFLIVLLTMNCSFVLAGMFLFGHRIIHFSRFDMAFESTFLMLFGSFDYNELAAEHPATAFLWFFFFIIGMYMVLLNMALAIFMDAYGGQKNKAELSESVMEQLIGVLGAIKKWHQRVPASSLLQTVNKLDADMVSKRMLLEACPELEDEQAGDVMTRVEAAESLEDEDALTLSDAFKLVVSIRDSVVSLGNQVNALISSQQRRMQEAYATGDGRMGSGRQLLPEADQQLQKLERRASALEEFLNEVMSYMVLRGKEARDRLEVMEEHLRRQGGIAVPSWAAGAGGVGKSASRTPSQRRN